MNVSAIQSVASGLGGTATLSNAQKTLPSWPGPAAILDLNGTSASGSATGTYDNLSGFARSAGDVLQSLAGASLQQGAVRQYLVVQTATARREEQRTGLLSAAVKAIDQGDTARAREIARDLLQKDGRDAAAAHVIGRSYLLEGDYASAETYFARAASLAPNSQRFRSDWENAKLLQESDGEVLAEAARRVRQPNRRSEGIRLLGYLTRRSPGNAEAHLMLGDALMDEGEVVLGIKSYQNALAVGDENILARLVDRLKALVAKAPDVGITRNLLGHALRRLGRFAEARIELQRAADIAPANVTYQTDVASVSGDLGAEALTQGRAADAVRHYQDAVALDASSDVLHGGLALAHAAMSQWWLMRGQSSKAFMELTSAKLHLRTGQDASRRQVARNFHNLADRYEKQGNWGWALSCYANAHELDSSNRTYRSDLGAAYDAMGTRLFDEGKYADAEIYYQKAVDLFPGNATYRTHLQAAKDAR